MANTYNALLSTHILSRGPDFSVHGAEATAIAAAATLVDSGALPQGISATIGVMLTLSGDDSVPFWEVVQQRASADVTGGIAYIGAAAAPGSWSGFFTGILANDHIIVRAKGAGTSAKIYQGDLYIYRM